jgi:hypothetical protein
MRSPPHLVRIAWAGLLVAGFGSIAALNWPGHLPYDSVTGLWEGRRLQSISWGPRMYAAVLGAFDHVVAGPAPYTLFQLALLAAAWAALPALGRRAAWSGPAALALAFALPQVLIFQGIVWRDVLFANLAVFAFTALALAAARWQRGGLRWSLLAGAAAALALGALVRQNGGVTIAPWALALGWIGARGSWRRGLAWAAGGLAAPLLLAGLLSAANPVREAPHVPSGVGLRLLARYDLVAALAKDPAYPLPILAHDNPAALAAARREAPRAYSPERIDLLARDAALTEALRAFHKPALVAAWRQMIAHDPAGYAARRLELFRWVFLTPRLAACVPLHLGVDGRADLERALGLTHGLRPRDGGLLAYATPWFETPAYSHLTYALAAAALAVVLLLRRRPADIAMAGLMLGALGFAASFFVLTLACDYRYLYAVDLAAITGLLHLALDPRLRGDQGRRRPGALG